jgi:hypothetical protein
MSEVHLTSPSDDQEPGRHSIEEASIGREEMSASWGLKMGASSESWAFNCITNGKLDSACTSSTVKPTCADTTFAPCGIWTFAKRTPTSCSWQKPLDALSESVSSSRSELPTKTE